MTIMAETDHGTDGTVAGSSLNLLVADDEHLVASGLASNLHELGHVVIGPAPDGQAAIDMCREHRPDMALLDIRMPRVDGIDAAKVIFEELGIPVVIFSAYSDQSYADRGAKAGVFNYLLKPVTPDQLRVGVTVAWIRFQNHLAQHKEIADLRERLENRKVIEQAKWLLVKSRQIEEPEAMKLLQRHARNNRRALIDVARSVLEVQALPD